MNKVRKIANKSSLASIQSQKMYFRLRKIDNAESYRKNRKSEEENNFTKRMVNSINKKG